MGRLEELREDLCSCSTESQGTSGTGRQGRDRQVQDPGGLLAQGKDGRLCCYCAGKSRKRLTLESGMIKFPFPKHYSAL